MFIEYLNCFSGNLGAIFFLYFFQDLVFKKKSLEDELIIYLLITVFENVENQSKGFRKQEISRKCIRTAQQLVQHDC